MSAWITNIPAVSIDTVFLYPLLNSGPFVVTFHVLLHKKEKNYRLDPVYPFYKGWMVGIFYPVDGAGSVYWVFLLFFIAIGCSWPTSHPSCFDPFYRIFCILVCLFSLLSDGSLFIRFSYLFIANCLDFYSSGFSTVSLYILWTFCLAEELVSN